MISFIVKRPSLIMPFAKRYRLTKEKDIEKVFLKGKAIKNGILFAKMIGNTLGHTRIAITVSKKVSNKAVDRNRIKRKISASLPERLKSLGVDIVIVANPSIVKSSFEEIGVSVMSVLNKIW